MLASMRGEGNKTQAESEAGVMTNLGQQQAATETLRGLQDGGTALAAYVPLEMLAA